MAIKGAFLGKINIRPGVVELNDTEKELYCVSVPIVTPFDMLCHQRAILLGWAVSSA